MNPPLTTSLADHGQQFIGQLLPLIGQFGWAAIVWALLFAVLAGVLAMIICVVFFKKGYLERHTMPWNVASKLSYVVILIGLPLLGASLGSLYGAQRQIPALLKEQVQPLVAEQMPGLREYIALQVKNVPLDKSVPDMVVKVIESKVNAWFFSMVLMFAMLTLAFALLIGADIVIYRRYFRPGGVSAKPQ